MPYRYSKARLTHRNKVTALLQTESETYRAKPLSKPAKDNALCGAMLLCSAAFESYIEDLISDWATAITSNSIQTDKLPKSVRLFLLNNPRVLAAYRRFFYDGDEGALFTSLESAMLGGSIVFAHDGRPVPLFAAGAVYNKVKYPSPRNLAKLFKRLGIGDPFGTLNRIAKVDVAARMESFNDVRTAMAHSGVPPGLSRTDVRDHIASSTRTVGYIDRMFYNYVSQSIGYNCWEV